MWRFVILLDQWSCTILNYQFKYKRFIGVYNFKLLAGGFW